jgi:plasmid stabilization system protein ParE
MTYRVELLPDAMLDIEETFLWYQAVSPQLSDNFRSKLETALQEIQLHPLAFHSLSRKVRCRKLKRFPYLVIFSVQKDVISVVAVIHERRNPRLWRQKFRRK